MVFPKSAILDTCRKTFSGFGEIEMLPEIEGNASRYLLTNGNLPRPIGWIGDLSASWKVSIVRTAYSRWG